MSRDKAAWLKAEEDETKRGIEDEVLQWSVVSVLSLSNSLPRSGRHMSSLITMEEPSFVSGATTNRTGEISDSNSSSSLHYPNPNGGGGPLPSKFKGVVIQPNGHWGDQIYAKDQRIWLGTFKSEKEAAAAYDSAAIKLWNGSMHRNFPRTEITEYELGFQKEHPGVGLRQLFQKELTPSDVSKLNRLVIPEKYALKYFPRIPDLKGRCDNFGGSNNGDDIELVFFDRWMRSWKLRYCYWRSSQSFVFTKGWNRFAKEKRLRPRDKVIFSSYESGGGGKDCVLLTWHIMTTMVRWSVGLWEVVIVGLRRWR
ncbi:hypothetical protein OROGR_013713 [Orobanche gracilis]